MPRYSRLVASLAAAGLGATVLAACTPVESGDGSDFPNDDIRLIIQADAGGGSDLSSRALAVELEKSLDVSVIPENMPGASGAKAMEYIAAQDPDGYTIGFAPVEIAMLNTTQNADVLPENYDFLGQIMNAPGVLSVGADSGIESLDDLIAAAENGEVTVSNSGAGSIWEAASLGLADAAGIEITTVPYDGGAPAVGAAASGEVTAAVSGVGEAIAQEGSVVPLVVMDSERHPDLPDVPTANEALGVEDVIFGGWGGIYAPVGLPDEVKSTLEQAIADAVASDSYNEFQADAGNLVVYRDAAEHQAFVEEQFARFQELLG